MREVYGAEFFDFSLWWTLPLVMIVVCFFMIRGRGGSIMCGFGSHDADIDHSQTSESTKEILDRRYARGEIGRKEYEEKTKALAGEPDAHRG